VFRLFSGGAQLMIPEQLDLVLNTLGYELTPLELADFVREVDLNGNGLVDFDEFVILIFRKLQDTAR